MPAQPDGDRSREPRGSRRSSRLGRWGSLRGGAGVGIIAGSAVLGAGITIATRAQPGRVLGGCIVAGTVAAALTVRPRSGRLIFPVPSLSYLIAALVAGIVYNRSTSKTELALGATQWIADGFFLMALATVLAIVITTSRWYLGWRGRRSQPAPDRYAAPRPSGPQPGSRPQGSAGPGQRNGQYPGYFYGGPNYGSYPGQRDARHGHRRRGPAYDQRPGSGPYNFSSGA
jgi:hypothetical protein